MNTSNANMSEIMLSQLRENVAKRENGNDISRNLMENFIERVFLRDSGVKEVQTTLGSNQPGTTITRINPQSKGQSAVLLRKMAENIAQRQ